MNLLPFRDREHAQGRRGHDAEGAFRADEEPSQVEAGRGSHRGTGAEDRPVREDRLEAEDLISHRPSQVTRVPNPVRADRTTQGRARPRPRIVAEGEARLPETTIQRLQDDAGLRGRSVRRAVDREDPSHPTHVEDDRIGRGSGPSHETGAAAPRDDREASIRGKVDDDRDVLRGAGPDDRGGSHPSFREAGATMGAERIEPVSGWDRRLGRNLVRAETLRELRESRAHADGNAAALFNPRGTSCAHEVIQRIRLALRGGVPVVFEAHRDPGVWELDEVFLIALKSVEFRFHG